MSRVPPFASAEITAAILAGGQGTRVDNADKGLMLLAGQPLIAHVCARLRGQAGRIVICANRNADAYGEYAPVIGDGVDAFRGPLAGIAAALASCGTRWLMTVPVDAPQPPADLAARLWAAAHGATQLTPAVVRHGGQREPLFALYPSGLAGAARTALAVDASVWRWQDASGAVEVDFSDEAAAFANLNTAADFHSWEERAHA